MKIKNIYAICENKFQEKIADKIIKHVTKFDYLDCNISCQQDEEISIKLNCFQMFCGTIRITLRHKATR
jgi:hypothetical protein